MVEESGLHMRRRVGIYFIANILFIWLQDVQRVKYAWYNFKIVIFNLNYEMNIFQIKNYVNY